MSPFVVCVAIGKLVLKKEVEKTTMEKGFELCKSTEKKEKCDCESCNLCRIFFSATFCLLTSSTLSQFSLFAYGPKLYSIPIIWVFYCNEVSLYLLFLGHLNRLKRSENLESQYDFDIFSLFSR